MQYFEKMDFIPFKDGRIACVKGEICKIYGMMIGSVLRTNTNHHWPEVVTYRIPLKGEERMPMNQMNSPMTTPFDLVVSSDTKHLTPKEMFRMIDSVQYYMKYKKTEEALRFTLKALSDCDAMGKMSKNLFFELDFERNEKGDSFINGYKIENNELVLVLAEIQRFAKVLVLLNPEREDNLLSEQAHILQILLNETYYKGLKSGKKDGKVYYFTGEYTFGENWFELEKMPFSDFKKNYEEVVDVISAEDDL